MTQTENAPCRAAASAGPTPSHTAAAGQGDADRHADDFAPMLAGARARGMFDALDLTGQAAILLDRDGRALATTSATQAVFGVSLELVDARPVGVEDDDARRLQRAIRDALAGRAAQIAIGGGSDAAIVRLLPVPSDRNQLLAAILLISPAPCAPRALTNSRAAAPALFEARN